MLFVSNRHQILGSLFCRCTVCICIPTIHPVAHYYRWILGLLIGLLASIKACNKVVGISVEEKRHTVSLLACLVDDTMHVGNVLIVCPAHKQVPCVHDHSPWCWLDVHPLVCHAVPHLQTADLILEENCNRSEVGMGSDPCGLMLSNLFLVLRQARTTAYLARLPTHQAAETGSAVDASLQWGDRRTW